ncbi:hypothetical protein NKI20_00810 [Mesorhizobium sp. M0830]|uniref:hypothetical protein n=1 Tax=Mesorhizobium sp. M0830 TaxID=2957008 RepID=UPI0033372075
MVAGNPDQDLIEADLETCLAVWLALASDDGLGFIEIVDISRLGQTIGGADGQQATQNKGKAQKRPHVLPSGSRLSATL